MLAVLDLCSGSVWISPWAVEAGSLREQVLWQIRLPKVLTAILSGAALSMSGLTLQTLFRNPLAGPYILGVSSGAGLGVAIVTMCATLFGFATAGATSIATAAVLGAMGIVLLVMGIARRVKDNVSLLIVGMMFGSIAGALINLIQNIADPDALKLFIVWTLGSLQNVGWTEMYVLLPILLVGFAVVMMLVKPLNGLLLGENYARGLGIHVESIRLLVVLSTGLLAGGITAFCGPIAFVGVAVPHIARGLYKTSNHRTTLPASALIGANLLLVCDILSSLSTYPLPISTVSALFGAPIIVAIILRKR